MATADYVTHSHEKCRICREIDVKERKLAKECDNLVRWRKESRKFEASIEKAEEEVRQLATQIRELRRRRPAAQTPAGPPAPIHPPLPADPGKQKDSWVLFNADV